MAFHTTTVAYNGPGSTPDTPAKTLTELQRVARALGVPATLHLDTHTRNVTVDANDRWLLLGPGSTALGVTITVRSGGVVMVL